jgi:putative ABC transport system ATP-binding protein
MIIGNNVSFSYKNKRFGEKVIFYNADFKFETGKIYAIYGPSGEGKSTLLSLLGGLNYPISGEITVDGKLTSSLSSEELRGKYVSYVFQDYYLFPYLSAVDNVIMAFHSSYRKVKGTAVECLNNLGISKEDLNRKVKFLSGGQQQRVAIARSLVSGSRYILADEPTGNLDPENAIKIAEIFKDLAAKDKCIIIATHADIFKEIADTVICIKDKKLNYDN